MYLFWLFEKILHRFTGVDGHSHGSVSHGHGHSHGDGDGNHSHSGDENHNNETKTNTGSTRGSASSTITLVEKPEVAEVNVIKWPKKPDSKPKKNTKCCNLRSIKTIGWIILLSDLIHNFADGLAVGASFSESVQMGITTSIAVICHEVPHELGNYAVLVKSGFSHLQALFFNFLSALPAFVAFYVGASIPSETNASVWILSVTAGMFLYISLVELMPSVLAGPKWGLKEFVLTNLGLWLGFTIMFLLVIFEEHIRW